MEIIKNKKNEFMGSHKEKNEKQIHGKIHKEIENR